MFTRQDIHDGLECRKTMVDAGNRIWEFFFDDDRFIVEIEGPNNHPSTITVVDGNDVIARRPARGDETWKKARRIAIGEVYIASNVNGVY